MQRKDLLLLTFLLSQTAPLWAMDVSEQLGTHSSHTIPVTPTVSLIKPADQLTEVSDVHELQVAFVRIRRFIEDNRTTLSAGINVMFLGDSGAGKSTLVDFLVNDDLFVLDDAGKLEAKNSVSTIGHRGSQTTFPILCRDPSHTFTLVDCAGFEDSGGPKRDIIHAHLMQLLFSEKLSGHSKIVLAVEEEALSLNRGQKFLKLMDRVTKTFPLDQLMNGLMLVITKQGSSSRSNPYKKLQDLLETTAASHLSSPLGTSSTAAQPPFHALTDDVRKLLSHLMVKEHIARRIPFFPFPAASLATGEKYQPPEVRQNILNGIQALEPLKNPNVRIQLPAESVELIKELAHTLNHQITHSLKDVIGPKIGQLSSTQIDAYASPGNLTELRDNLTALKAAHGLLTQGQPENMVDFAKPLNRFFGAHNLDDSNVITECAKTLAFLKTLTDKVADAKDTWVLALQTTIDDIHLLMTRKINTLIYKVTCSIDTINKRIHQICTEIQGSNEEEKNIEELKDHLAHIRQAIAVFQAPENILDFADLLQKYFYGSGSNNLKEAANALASFQVLNHNVPYPLANWSNNFQPSIQSLQNSMVEKEKIIALKKHAEDERLRREEEERARAAQEKLRLELEERRLALEEATLRQAEEQRQRHLEEMKRQQEERDRQQAEFREYQEQIERKAAADEVIRQRQKEETDRKAEEQRQAHLADIARLRDEAAAAEQRRLADLEAHRKEKEETDRIAAEQRAAIALLAGQVAAQQEAERQRLAREKAAADEVAESKRLLALPRGTPITAAQYNLLPSNKRRAINKRTGIIYYKI